MRRNSLKVWQIAVIAVAVVTGCAKNEGPAGIDVETGSVNGMVLRASMPDGVTRTTLSEDYQVLWQAGDKVSVNGSLSNAVTSTDNGKKAVEFTINGTLSAPYKVLYPGTTSANVISLPATQNYVAGSFDPVAAASFGNARKSGDAYIASLTHFCGILRFAINGSATLSRIELNSLGGEKLYGDFTLATDGDGFTGSWTGGTAGTLTYSFGSGLALGSSDTPICVAIPAQAYASGLEALVYQQDGAYMRLKFWGSGETLGPDDIIEFASKTFAAGRTENLFSIADLIAEDGGDPTAASPGITVGVYNIKMAENRAGTYADYISMDRADVQAGLGSTIAGMGADIFGINEIGEDNMPGKTHDIKAWAIAQGLSSSDYTWMMDYPNRVDRDGTWLTGYTYSADMYYANVFAYNKNTIAVEDDDYVWLCNDEDNYYETKSDAYGHGRHTAVYAKCRHKVSGKRFWFIVTHFDTYYGNSDGDNLHNVKSFKKFAQHLKSEEDLPIIAVGDLNFGSKEEDKTTDCPNYTTLTSYWTNVYDTMYAAHNAAGDLSSWYYKTYNGTQSGSQHSYYYPFITFTKNHPDRRLDHIVYKNSASHTVLPTSYRTIRRTYEAEDENTWCPSDHLAVVAYMTFD